MVTEHVGLGGQASQGGAQFGVVVAGALEGDDVGAGLAGQGGDEDEVALVHLVGEGGRAEA